MRQYATSHPDITRLYSIGRSVEGRVLWVMEVSDEPGVHEPGEPEFKYVGNMHGDEVVGRETLLNLIIYLCDNYDSDPRVAALVNFTRLHIMPTMNPDGYERATRVRGLGRENANGVDLNRNFPDRFGRSRGEIQPETRAIMDWIAQYPFVLSANLHGGAVVANYPYDSSPSGHAIYTATRDDDIFRQLSLSYASAHPAMQTGSNCGLEFINGITNGAAWYSISGGMQDYNYLNSNCMEITVEQLCDKFPNAGQLRDVWEDNVESLLAFAEQVHRGVRGFVWSASGDAIAGAGVAVGGRDHVVLSGEDGDYWRLLVPGNYTLTVRASGYTTATQNITVLDGEAVTVNFTLGGGAIQPLTSPLLMLLLFLLSVS